MKRLFESQSQHFHKSRQDRMLLPHRELSGLLFTINPRQEDRARREIVQFLEPIIAEIKKEYSPEDVECEEKLCSNSEEKMEKTENDDIVNGDNKSTYQLEANTHFDHSDNNAQSELTSSEYKSTSSLLALELNEAFSDNINNGNKKQKSDTHMSTTENYKRPRTHTTHDIKNCNDKNVINNIIDNDKNYTKHDLEEISKSKCDERNVQECHQSCKQYKEKEQWLHIRETNCKGYLFVQIPVIDRQKCCVVCNNTLNVPGTSNEINLRDTETNKQSTCSISGLPIITTQSFPTSCEENESCELVHCKKCDTIDSGNENSCTGSNITTDDKHTNHLKQHNLVAHSIVINPLVTITVERLFDNLLANPRPVFRSCFRLYPVELCCCPTLPEMQAAIQTLLNMHFPPKISALQNTSTASTNSSDANGVSMTTTEMNDNNNNLTRMDSNNLMRTEYNKLTNKNALESKSMSLPSLPSHCKYAHISLHTIALHVNVKNNTKVEEQKSWLTSQLLQCIPANRFILVSPQHMSQKKTSSSLSSSPLLVEAVITVNILHSTCCIGIQNDFDYRHKYNVHDIASESLQLQSESTFTSRVHAQPQEEEEEEQEEESNQYEVTSKIS